MTRPPSHHQTAASRIQCNTQYVFDEITGTCIEYLVCILCMQPEGIYACMHVFNYSRFAIDIMTLRWYPAMMTKHTHGPKQRPTVVFAPQRVQTHWHFIQVLYVGYNVHGTYSIATWALPL